MRGKLIIIFMMFLTVMCVLNTKKWEQLLSHKCQAMVDTTTNPICCGVKTILVFMLFLDIFFISSGYQSQVYSILCPSNSTIMTNYCTKISEGKSKSGAFLSRSHVGQDLGFSNKIRVILMKSGWLDSLKTVFTL